MRQLQAYSLRRELGEGEAYGAVTQEKEMLITAGKTVVHWQYVNDVRSGNEAVLSFNLDGEEIYCSGALALGKTLSGFELNRALEEGEYEVVAVARVYDEAGELRSSNRTPVMLRVQS